MSNSHITQNALARSLKKLMLTIPLNKITIQQIVNDCGLARHTFYNHFQDIYELLGWLYQVEIIEDLEQYRNYHGWKEAFLKVLQYTQENKTICLNAFHSLGREHLEQFLYGVIYDVITGVVDDLMKNITVSRQAKQDIADFYTRAILAQAIQWLKTGAKTDPNEIVEKVSRILYGNIRRSLENFHNGEIVNYL